jgi:hypothetical protein
LQGFQKTGGGTFWIFGKGLLPKFFYPYARENPCTSVTELVSGVSVYFSAEETILWLPKEERVELSYVRGSYKIRKKKVRKGR